MVNPYLSMVPDPDLLWAQAERESHVRHSGWYPQICSHVSQLELEPDISVLIYQGTSN